MSNSIGVGPMVIIMASGAWAMATLISDEGIAISRSVSDWRICPFDQPTVRGQLGHVYHLSAVLSIGLFGWALWFFGNRFIGAITFGLAGIGIESAAATATSLWALSFFIRSHRKDTSRTLPDVAGASSSTIARWMFRMFIGLGILLYGIGFVWWVNWQIL